MEHHCFRPFSPQSWSACRYQWLPTARDDLPPTQDGSTQNLKVESGLALLGCHGFSVRLWGQEGVPLAASLREDFLSTEASPAQAEVQALSAMQTAKGGKTTVLHFILNVLDAETWRAVKNKNMKAAPPV